MEKKLEGKIAIITGGASGIGEATARLFREHGARVVVADIQDELGRQVAESIGCSYIHCDVTDEDQVKAMVSWTITTFGHLDIMFSNAGIVGTTDQTILSLDLSQYDHVLRVNARGMAVCVKHAALVMAEQRVRGSIICTSSVLGTKGGGAWTDYAMSKHAVIGLVRSASLQLGVHGIRVNSVSPSAIMTPLIDKAHLDPEVIKKAFESVTTLKGIEPTVRHIADAALFLASDDSAFIS